MGRWSTGVVTTDGALRLELPYQLKNGFIKKGYQTTALFNWTDDSTVGC